MVEGTSIVLMLVPGEASVKYKSGMPPGAVASVLKAVNGVNFSRERDLPHNMGKYKMDSVAQVAEAVSLSAIESLNQNPDIEYAYPVYKNAATGLRQFLNDEIVICLKGDFDPIPFGLHVIDTLDAKRGIHVLKLTEPKKLNPYKLCLAISHRPEVAWVEPNMAQEARQFAIPNDTLFGDQWHLRNTGQNGAFSGADVNAANAWDGSQGYGSAGIRIGILDDGVQTDHPDLSANIVPGYDFYDQDSNPNPEGAYDNHGTAVAGVAAAVINNSLGVAGIAGGCKILPVRIMHATDDSGFADVSSLSDVYRALVYAGDNADVLSCSWGLGSYNSTISSGFSYALYNGRGGKGCPVLCSSGNSACGYGLSSYNTPWAYNIYEAAGTNDHGSSRIHFKYWKAPNAVNGGDDCYWLADVTLPNGWKERFDGATRGDWSLYSSTNCWTNYIYGASIWTGSIDPEHAHGTSRYAWRPGAITNEQTSGILSPYMTINSQQSTVIFRRWISSGFGSYAMVDLRFITQTLLGGSGCQRYGGVEDQTTDVSFPANLSGVLAVGASSDFDYRSAYSEYGSTLAFLAPSLGGYGKIVTTDRTGTDGYASGDYDTNFGGTSASAPLAAGIAALVLSKDGNLTRTQVGDKLKQNCDKIGSVSYSGSPSRNDYYGCGRLNAYSALTNVTTDTTSPTFNSATVINYRAVDASFSEPMGPSAMDTNYYQITSGQGTLSSNPAKVVRITPTLYRLLWTSGDMATNGTVTITASSSIKDVAGNSIVTYFSRSSTGTKRVFPINCGEESEYTPPFIYDKYQGNEFVFSRSTTPTYYTTSTVATNYVSDPAPEAVYKTLRCYWSEYGGTNSSITYSIPASSLPGGSYYKVRLHFADLYWGGVEGKQVFDINVNAYCYYEGFDLGVAVGTYNRAYISEVPNITPTSGYITIELTPQQTEDGYYRVSINGIEIVKQ
jgi:subtilisin family serine protease